ncbi:MAG TPA: sigma-54 dependent transcriptional regulator [Myxococcota bacterium]|nr:sigma-54 dependent transcriptional regulator [Myxococcota bacterium]
MPNDGTMATVKSAAQLERILVVDDDPEGARQARTALLDEEREVRIAHSAREALTLVHDEDFDLIVLTLEVRDLEGPRILDVFSERAAGVPLVALTRSPSIPGAVDAVRRGATDYLAKPVHRRGLIEAARTALDTAKTSRELQAARERVQDRYGFSHLLTRSPKMLQVFDQVRAVAGTDATVLIRGETGTGKELISRAIHERSRRRERPFISVNCGAFTETLLESELFGHEKGSFTGASARRSGVFEMADGGTLFLDELGETSLSVQVNLLRVLDEMSFRRVGGHDLVRVDVRVLAATNLDLEHAVRRGDFREDLFYRLDVFPIILPPLRDRREDIPLLIRHFLDDASQEYGLQPPQIGPEAMGAVLEYQWPGNVRQLRALCERWLIARSGQRLEKEHLPSEMLGKTAVGQADPELRIDDRLPLTENVKRASDRVERAYFHALLTRHEGHLGKTAESAGITRRTLYTKMKALDLDHADYRSGPTPGRPRR